jgi:biotin carboxyl carrier protein
MRYFVTLSGREFPLRLEQTAGAGPQLWAPPLAAKSSPQPPVPGEPESTCERELGVESLRPARQGRPALVCVEGRLFRVLHETAPGPGSRAARHAGLARVRVNGQPLRVELETELGRRVRPATAVARASGTRVVAPMPGRVVKVNVRVGDSVVSGTPLLSVEAMKMENELQSPGAGRVVSVHVQVGATVESDQELVVIAPES